MNFQFCVKNSTIESCSFISHDYQPNSFEIYFYFYHLTFKFKPQKKFLINFRARVVYLIFNHKTLNSLSHTLLSDNFSYIEIRVDKYRFTYSGTACWNRLKRFLFARKVSIKKGKHLIQLIYNSFMIRWLCDTMKLLFNLGFSRNFEQIKFNHNFKMMRDTNLSMKQFLLDFRIFRGATHILHCGNFFHY